MATWATSFAEASTPTWRAPGKLGTHIRAVFLNPELSGCHRVLEMESGKGNWKGNWQGNHSLPIMVFSVSWTDWLLTGKHSISMFNYTQKLVLERVSTVIKLTDNGCTHISSLRQVPTHFRVWRQPRATLVSGHGNSRIIFFHRRKWDPCV